MRLNGLGLRLSIAAALSVSPVLVPSASARDCVQVVRAISDFDDIQGDAWRWWSNAAGRYERGRYPVKGSVLVFKRFSKMRRGHVSLVSGIIDERTILVDHSWEDGRGLRRRQKVIDISPNNDWSQVQVWHPPTQQIGQTVYPIAGFILPPGSGPDRNAEVEFRQAALDSSIDDADELTPPMAVAPTGRDIRPVARMTLIPNRPTIRTASVLPRRKPGSETAGAVATAQAPVAPIVATASVLPVRKPAAERVQVASSPTVTPGRKPGATAVAQLAPSSR